MESEGLDEDAVMMQALDAGAEDFLVEEGVFEIYTAPDDFSTVREALAIGAGEILSGLYRDPRRLGSLDVYKRQGFAPPRGLASLCLPPL